MEIGSLVQYYDGGWRTGHVVEFEEQRVGRTRKKARTGRVKIRPIRAFKAGTPRSVTVHLGDVKEIES